MDNQPSFDRDLLLPILVGGFSIFGIIIILLIGRLNASRASVDVVDTETPFKYIFLGTEPLNSTGSPDASGTELVTDLPLDSPTPPSPDTTSSPGTPALDTPTPGTPNSTASPDFASGPPPLNPGTYDDAHPSLGYSPGWEGQTDVNGASESTMHVSSSIGSAISFRFIGRELRIFYLSGASLGEVTIAIDGQSSTVDQSDSSSGNEWISNPLTNNTHNVVITHLRGGSVNFDYMIIPAIGPTGTPTVTSAGPPTGGSPPP